MDHRGSRQITFAAWMTAALVVLAAPLAADAQEAKAEKVRRIGYLSEGSAEADKDRLAAFRRGLREMGYVEGQNIIIEQRHAEQLSQSLGELAADLIRLKVEVAVIHGTHAMLAVQKADRSLPIVMAVHADPVGTGLVTSLARPGGQITGLMDGHADLAPKRLQLLKEAAPSISRVAALFNPATPHAVRQLKHIQAAAPGLSLTVLPFEVGRPDDIDRALARIGRERAGAIFIIPDPSWWIGHQGRVTFEYPGADPEVLKKLGPRKIVDWVALPFLGIPPALSMAQLIMSGVFDRLPDLEIFLAETRLGWVPFWMEEADYWYEQHRHWAERLLHVKPLKQRPSDYVRRHISFSVQHVERVAIELRHHLGVEHIMFATDFPHIECDWPNTRPFAERLFAGVPSDEAFKIAAGNTLRFFGLGDTPMGRTVLAAAH